MSHKLYSNLYGEISYGEILLLSPSFLREIVNVQAMDTRHFLRVDGVPRYKAKCMYIVCTFATIHLFVFLTPIIPRVHCFH